MQRIKQKIINFIYDYIYIPVFFKIIYVRDLRRMTAACGKFEELSKKEQREYTLLYQGESKNICGLLVPEIVKIIIDLNLKPGRVLLDGDDWSVVEQFKNRFNFYNTNVLTAGKEGNFHFDWDFEDNKPINLDGDFDLIVSQAMFEHLVDPYKHFADLAKLLKSRSGYLVIHTHLPGYTYHRYPIDAVRFFPDWFEAVAERNGLAVKRKFLRNFHIIYLFEKTKF